MHGRDIDYEAYYLAKFPSHEAELRHALVWLREWLTNHPGVHPMVVAPTRRHFKDHALLEQASTAMTAATPKDVLGLARGDLVVVAAWPTSDGLAVIDELPGLRALCVVPWIEDDLDVWLRARRPTDLLGIADRTPEPQISEPVVHEAMKSLTITVNLSSGLSHPSDKAAAVLAFRELRSHGYQWDPVEVEAWARANGWSARGAGELREIAEGVRDGRRFRLAQRAFWKPDIVEIWKTAAAGEG